MLLKILDATSAEDFFFRLSSVATKWRSLV